MHFKFTSLISLLVLSASFIASAARADMTEDPRADEVIITDQEAFKNPLMSTPNLWVEDGRAEALAILKGALQMANMQGLKDRVEQLSRTEASLAKAKILSPKPGTDFFFCNVQKDVIAYVNRLSPSTIKLCGTVASLTSDIKFIAQILIHEGAHTARYFDECKATEVELVGMKMSGVGIQFENGYWAQCGFTRENP